MAMFFEVTDDVLEIADLIIKRHHKDLTEAKVAFVFRDEPQKSGLKEVWGQASKVADKFHPHLNADFLIWIARDVWVTLAYEQKMALIDHELCHCSYDFVEQKAKINQHDIEEFYCIIERYGFWRPDLVRGADAMEKAVQMQLDLPKDDKRTEINVFALSPDKVPAGM